MRSIHVASGAWVTAPKATAPGPPPPEKREWNIPSALGRHNTTSNWQAGGTVVSQWWVLQAGKKCIELEPKQGFYTLYLIQPLSSCVSLGNHTLSLGLNGLVSLTRLDYLNFRNSCCERGEVHVHFVQKVLREDRAKEEERVSLRDREFVHWHKQWNTQGGWIMSRKPEKTRERTNI